MPFFQGVLSNKAVLSNLSQYLLCALIEATPTYLPFHMEGTDTQNLNDENLGGLEVCDFGS